MCIVVCVSGSELCLFPLLYTWRLYEGRKQHRLMHLQPLPATLVMVPEEVVDT